MAEKAPWKVCQVKGCQVKGHRHLPIQRVKNSKIVVIPDRFRALITDRSDWGR